MLKHFMEPEELYSKMMGNIGQIRDEVIASSLEAQINLMNGMLKNALKDSGVDPLTQLLNYKGLIEILERETAQAKRFNEPLALGFVDFNKLLEYNDAYGEAQANHAINQVAHAIKNSLSAQDLIARYFGGRFCIVLPKTDLESSKPVAERIKENLDSLVVGGLVEGHLDENYQKIAVSIGVAALQGNENYANVLNRANKAVKKAKTASGNTSSIVYI